MTTKRVIALLATVVTGCTAGGGDGDDAADCIDGKCDGFGGAEVLATLSDQVDNPDSYPRGFAALGDKALFFSALRKGLWITDGTDAGTKLVRDLEPTLDAYQRTPVIVTLGGKAYWSFMGAVWTSDGTPAGTTQLIDLGYSASQLMTDVVVVDGELMFGANKSLYISDGTTAGTRVLASIEVVGDFQVVGSLLYFPCTRTDVGQELCVTDKTAAGTRVVKDIRPGIQGTGPRFLGALGARVLFSAQAGPSFAQRSLWVSDGTDAGTIQLMAEQTNGDTVRNDAEAVVLDGRLYFGCYTASAGFELCASDGTVAGTSVLDLVPGSAGSSSPWSFTLLGDRMYFIASSPATGRELWSSDGTVAGSGVVVDLRTNANDRDGVAFTKLVRFGNEILFAARGPGDHQDLWRTDGTAAGTTKIASILAQGMPQRHALGLHDAIVLGDKLVFAADDGKHGLEPWITDGTAQGTRLLRDVGAPVSKASAVDATTFGNGSFFAVDDGTATQIWRTNGTKDGTAKYQQLDRQTIPGFTAVGTSLFYRGQRALWRSDGTQAGIAKVRDLPGTASELVALGNKLAFTGTTANQSRGLWISDGTAAGTVETGAINAEYLAAASGRLWLTALYGSAGNELWTSDGTVAGTKPVLDIHPSGSAKPSGFTGLAGKTLFAATDATAGSELWVTDGTAAGTARVADIAPGTRGSGPFGLFAWNGVALLWAAPTAAGYELWRTDGTAAGTTRIKAISYGGAGKFVAWGEHVFFVAKDAAGAELWRTDGTEAGTVRVADIYDGPLSSNPSDIVLAGKTGPLYFVAEEPLGGREVWKLDAPTATPVRAADVLPGPRSSRPSHLQPRGGALFFVADAGNGQSLFRLGPAPDVIAPTIECPANLTVTASQADGVEVSFPMPTASDNDGAASVTTSPVSGDKFPVGTTTVTATATDSASNTASCTFDVTVTHADGGGGSGSGSGTGSGSIDPDDGHEHDGGGCAATGSGTLGVLGVLLLAGLRRRRRCPSRGA